MAEGVVKDTLLLNADWTPLQVLDWQRAVWLVLVERVRPVAEYRDLHVRSARLRLPWPAVVALDRHSPVETGKVALSRASILARDGFTCQYCGWSRRSPAGRPLIEPLTVDHVVPRARALGGRVRLPDGREVPVTSWENTTTACKACNGRKGARTPAEARMRLRRTPRAPSPSDALRIAFARVEIEEEWAPFLPRGTGIRRRDRSAA